MTSRTSSQQWNKAHPDQKVTLKEQSDSADQQHDDLVQHFKAKDPGYDVVSVDVVWTPEFAAQGWLQPLKGKFALDTTPLLKAAVDAATYQGKLYAAPITTDGGMLYYRKDLVPKPPDDLGRAAGRLQDRQGAQHRLLRGPVRQVRGPDRQRLRGDQRRRRHIVGTRRQDRRRRHPAGRAGLSFLADAYKNGDIPKEAITFQEEQGRQAFESGKLMFLRNWSYVYNLAKTDGSSVVKGKFAVAPEPGPNGIGASTLGGHSLGMSVYSKHKATALDFMKFYESERPSSAGCW